MTKQHRTILIVDDNEDVSHVLALTLRDKGFTVLEAEDGEIGCEMAIAQRPILILCDEQMPRLDGLHTLLRLKNKPETAAIPVLMIGGSGLVSNETWQARGASGSLSKPFRMDELLAVVEKSLQVEKPRCDMGRKPTILLLEDDENDVFFFRRALTACEYRGDLRVMKTTHEARDYLEGRGEFRDRMSDPLPDLIVTDLQVNRTNAIEFLDWLRQQESCKEIPVVVYTGMAPPRDKTLALERGVVALFTKSSDPLEMRARVKSILKFVPKPEQ